MPMLAMDLVPAVVAALDLRKAAPRCHHEASMQVLDVSKVSPRSRDNHLQQCLCSEMCRNSTPTAYGGPWSRSSHRPYLLVLPYLVVLPMLEGQEERK